MINLQEILPILHEKTLANKIDWTKSGSHMIKTEVREFTIGIIYRKNTLDYVMALFDRNGRTIEEFKADSFEEHFSELNEIYTIVDRHIRNVDESISKVKSLLEAL